MVPIYMFSKDKTSNATKLNPPKEEPITTKVEVFETKADLKDGEMRAFQIGPKEEDAVLIVKHSKYALKKMGSTTVSKTSAATLASASPKEIYSETRSCVLFIMLPSPSKVDVPTLDPSLTDSRRTKLRKAMAF